MILFFDTSALVKFFYEEKGSDIVTDLITSKQNEIWLLELVRIEFYCALYRRFRNNEIREDQLNIAISGFNEELYTFYVEPIRHTTIKEAESLINNYGKKFGLRTLDSLHLAAFLLIATQDWYFVVADDKLNDLIKIMGYNTINPMNI
ncbi:protein containing PilT protein, partial [Candidatus Magnetomorum sp. HK-1]